MYPNPVDDILYIQNQNFIIIKKIEVYNILGKLVLENKKMVFQLIMSTLDSGLYFVKIESDKGIVTKKVIKK